VLTFTGYLYYCRIDFAINKKAYKWADSATYKCLKPSEGRVIGKFLVMVIKLRLLDCDNIKFLSFLIPKKQVYNVIRFLDIIL
jgi:hypothetical protein